MKRRTSRTSAVNAKLHRAAFEHAFRTFGNPKKRRSNRQRTHSRNSLRIRFFVELEIEAGGTFTAEFSCTRGFRFGGDEMGVLWEKTAPLKPENFRELPRRLQAYRDKLHAWNQAGNHGLTFRSLNLLLAALCFDLMPNP